MKNILSIATLSLLFSFGTTFPMQHSLDMQKIEIVIYTVAGCYLAYKYGHSVLSWLQRYLQQNKDTITSGKVDKKETNAVTCLQQNQDITASGKGDEKETKLPKIAAQKIDNNKGLLGLTPEDLAKLTQEKKAKEKQQAQEIKGQTELHVACDNNDVQRVRLLLQHNKVDVNALRQTKRSNYDYKILKEGGTALYIACKNKNRTIVNLLLSHDDIDVFLENDLGESPLCCVCEHGHQDLVEQFLAHKSMRFANNKALSIACEKGHKNIVERLLTYNTDNCMNINEGRSHPLLIICRQVKLCEVLILVMSLKQKTVDFKDLRSSDIYEEIEEILQNPNVSMIESRIGQERLKRDQLMSIALLLLRDDYIKINVVDYKRQTVFHSAVFNSELLQLLWQKNINEEEENQCSINAKDESGYTPLHSAAKAGNRESFFLLLDYGADISLKNNNNITPFEILCDLAVKEEITQNSTQTRYKDILVQLLKERETYNISQEMLDCGLLKLTLGSELNENYLLGLLLACGANPNAKCVWGWSPVLTAARYKNIDLLNLFIDNYGGDINQQSRFNNTVFYNAFMSEAVQSPNEITYFYNLMAQGKEQFMQQELAILVENGPESLELNVGYEVATVTKSIQRFNSFVDVCVVSSNGKLNIKELFNRAHAKMQERHNNFSSNTYKCMYSTNNNCYGHYDCKKHFGYNEIIVHALARHTDSCSVDKEIALIYKDSPVTYYAMPVEEKEEQKQMLCKLIGDKKEESFKRLWNIVKNISPQSQIQYSS